MPGEGFEHTNPVYVLHHTSARLIDLVAFHVFISADFECLPVLCTMTAKLYYIALPQT